ncbi:MAG: CopG family ribbon-helix-helix protein [Chroococcales cyanobacterium]
MNKETIPTTLMLPAPLLEATDKIIKEGKAKNRDEFIAQALKNELARQQRTEIDAALAEMAQDPDYQAEVLKMDAEFALASWEAFQEGESDA